MKSKGKILVVRGGAIGDFILTLPALKALREQFPETQIELLGYPQIAELAVASGFVDHVRAIEARGLAGFFARNGPLDSALVQYFGTFNLVVSYLYDPDAIFKDNLGRCTKAQFIAGPHRPNESLAVHATEVFLQPLERLAIYDADPEPALEFSAAPPSPMRTGSWLALHPGSGSERKNWPESQWTELLLYLVERSDWKLLLVGGEAEGERLARLAALIPDDRLFIIQNKPLVEVALHLKGCRFFLGHDSGISHLAAAVELPSLILWGETNQAIWKPRRSTTAVLQAPEGLARLSVVDVLSELEHRIRSRDAL